MSSLQNAQVNARTQQNEQQSAENDAVPSEDAEPVLRKV